MAVTVEALGYVGCMAALLAYALMQLHLVWIDRRADQPPEPPLRADRGSLPFLTDPLPVYTERHVIRRLINGGE